MLQHFIRRPTCSISQSLTRDLQTKASRCVLGLGLEGTRVVKNGAHPARVAEVGQENIETVHAPKHIQAADTP